MAEVAVRGHQSQKETGSQARPRFQTLQKVIQTFDWNHSERQKEMSKQLGLLTQIRRDLPLVNSWKMEGQ